MLGIRERHIQKSKCPFLTWLMSLSPRSTRNDEALHSSSSSSSKVIAAPTTQLLSVRARQHLDPQLSSQANTTDGCAHGWWRMGGGRE
jgi:hypothetical protein